MPDKLKFALIGCGRISAKHIEALINNNESLELVSLCDIVEQKATQKKNQYINLANQKNIKITEPVIYEDYNMLIAKNKIDVALIATESGKHFQIAIDCMEKKINVLIEKPMAMNEAQTDQMLAMGEKMDVTLGVCHQNRFNPSIQLLRKAIQEERFGNIYAGNVKILWTRDKNYYEEAKWRGTFEQDGGCLMNQCIHGIDALLWIMGEEPKVVNGMIKNYIHPYIETEDYGNIQIMFKNGSIGHIEGTVNVFDKNLCEMLTILGENGTAVIGGQAMNTIEYWRFKDNKDSLEEVQHICNQKIDNVYGYGHTPLFKNFINAVNGKEKLLVDGYEGKKAVKLVSELYSKDSKSLKMRGNEW